MIAELMQHWGSDGLDSHLKSIQTVYKRRAQLMHTSAQKVCIDLLLLLAGCNSSSQSRIWQAKACSCHTHSCWDLIYYVLNNDPHSFLLLFCVCTRPYCTLSVLTYHLCAKKRCILPSQGRMLHVASLYRTAQCLTHELACHTVLTLDGLPSVYTCLVFCKAT